MQNLDAIADRIHQSFEARNAARDHLLAQSRTLTRCCANAIRAVHRGENSLAEQNLAEAGALANAIRSTAAEYPDLYYAGYSQDALKEFAEASITYALLNDRPLPAPEELGLEYAAYLQGLAEAVGELRRRCLDALLKGNSHEAQRLMELMEDIYAILVTMDYPDVITGGLRRLTDIARGVTERTRGDLALSLRQENLEQSLRRLEERLQQ